MRIEELTPMTEGMETAHGNGWGGYYKDEGTTSYIGLYEDGFVVVGCLDGQWLAEYCDPEGYPVDDGCGKTPQEALNDLEG